MFSKIKDKIENSIAEREERRKEKERIEKEMMEQEKQRLLSMDEKELLVELIFAVRKIEKEQKALSEKVEDSETTIWSNH